MASADLISGGSAEGLLAFCDYLIEKGLATAGAINPWKSAVRGVCGSVEGSDDLTAVDVRQMDVEEYLGRFANRSRGKYKPESLEAYKGRFRKATEAYLGFLDDPAWRYQGASRATRKPSGERRGSDPGPSPDGRTRQSSEAVQAPDEASRQEGLIRYPFPVRDGQVAFLELPKALRADDAKRLARFIEALVVQHEDAPEAAPPAQVA